MTPIRITRPNASPLLFPSITTATEYLKTHIVTSGYTLPIHWTPATLGKLLRPTGEIRFESHGLKG